MAGNQASRVLRQWATRARRCARTPITNAMRAAVGALLEASALERMDRAVSPDGTPHRPLSEAYAARKQRQRGHRKIWQLSGDSKRRLRVTVTPAGVVLIINTPYSGAVHDGAVITHHHRPKTSSDLAAHARLVKGARRSARRRRKARNEMLMVRYHAKTAATARKRHANEMRLARNARNRGDAVLMPQYRRPRGQRAERQPKTSWTIRIPARPVLGVSAEDNIAISRILAKAMVNRLSDAAGE